MTSYPSTTYGTTISGYSIGTTDASEFSSWFDYIFGVNGGTNWYDVGFLQRVSQSVYEVFWTWTWPVLGGINCSETWNTSTSSYCSITFLFYYYMPFLLLLNVFWMFVPQTILFLVNITQTLIASLLAPDTEAKPETTTTSAATSAKLSIKDGLISYFSQFDVDRAAGY